MEDGSDISRLTNQLKLLPHPTVNGAFREIWKGNRQVTFVNKTSHNGTRASGNSTYFLLPTPYHIGWHQELSDMGFYWHAGGSLQIHLIKDDGGYTCHVLGDVTSHEDHVAQLVIPHDTWYAAELFSDSKYCLFSAVVMPGFEEEDWIEGKRKDMLERYPQHKELITKLTKED